MIIDLHCDTAFKLYKMKLKGENISIENNNADIDLNKLALGNVGCQCFAMCVTKREEKPYETCYNLLKYFREELQKYPDKVGIVERFSDFEKNEKAGKISAVLTMEDGVPLNGKMENLKTFYDLGVKMIALTWNFDNEIGSPNIWKYNPDGSANCKVPNTEKGLTDFGFELVKKMNELGMIIDVSHLSDKGFYDVIKTTDKPIVASHSNARSVCNHVRNLTDDMLYKLADNGGVVGMNFYPLFLAEGEQGKKIESVIQMIDYVKKRIGIDHIAFGSDFDGISEKNQLSGPDKYNLLLDKLVENNYSLSEIDKITHENALRVFKENI